ncbi:multidrug/pheromone exporter, ABC superfamily [Pseudomassariella vexata]|uniref:Multidrug/pheromone exporter, ABC superfamily n=1 Tax=Pseudomassariella vexata TaxID=1141098 RepID=A0A1Y2EA51_9PEZI|nr:multidrug/pheromone exporter, ABC superfamily [Pseudomassariella vexata]ORY68439.1 multidrug/pheromone exporter, ABC superfamily [Pseudomassariella vexata]
MADTSAASQAPAGPVAVTETDETGSLSNQKQGKKKSSGLQNCFRYFRLLVYAEPTANDIGLLLVGLFSAIGSGIPFPLIGILFGELVDNLNSATCAAQTETSAQQYQDDVNDKLLKVVYVAIAQFVLIYLYVVCWNLSGDRLAHRLRAKYLRSILKQEVSFFDKLPAGDVSARLTGDINTIKDGTSQKVGVVLGVVSLFVTAYIIAFIKNARLAGILVSILPAFLLLGALGTYYIGKFSGLMSEHMAKASGVALESLSNVMVVQAFRANDRLEKKFVEELWNTRKNGIKKAVATAIQSGFLYFLAYAASGLAYWQGSQTIADVVSGKLEGQTVGTTYTIIFVLVDGTLILSQMAPFIQIFASASAAFEKLEDDINRQSQIDGTLDSSAGTILSECEGEVRLENVNFTYPSRPDVPVIQDVSLRFPAKKYTAVVGLSGSGKSTIAGLVTRLYDPDQGSLFLDGHKLTDLNVRHLRGFIGLVQQDPLLLDRSLLENIALGLINSSREEHVALQPILYGDTLAKIAEAVRNGEDVTAVAASHGPEAVRIIEMVQHAATLADAGIFLDKLEYGFGTIVGPNGDLLSGGQKQRVALARALVKDPKILVLDEATSSLDSASEQRIQKAIEQATAGRTVISIAHRLATVKNADSIVVMRSGRVIEQGSHLELIAKDADYAALVRLQTMGSETSSVSTSKGSESAVEHDRVSRSMSVTNEKTPAAGLNMASEETSTPPAAETEKKTRATKATVKSINFFVRPYWIFLFIAFFFSVVVGGSYSSSAVLVGNTIGALSPCEPPSEIKSSGSFFALLFFILGIIELFANTISWSAFGWVAENILCTIRTLSYRSLMEQDLHWHQSENRTPSTLLAFITNDTTIIGGLTGSIMGTIFSIVVNFVVAVVLTHIIAWKIALVCLAVVPLMLGSGILQLNILAAFATRHEKAFAKSVSITVEAVNSIKTVAALSLEQEVLGTYRRSLNSPRKEMLRNCLWANVFLAFTFSLSNLLYALAYWWGAQNIINGTYTQTQFFIVLIALLVSAQQWGELFTLAPEVTNAGRAVGRILDLIDLGSTRTVEKKPSAIDDPEGAIESKPSGPTSDQGLQVSFKQLKFSYPARPNRQVLKGLDVDISPGQFCALVGPSGAGKSTIVSLLERMYHPDSGVIEIDGVDVTARKEAVFRDDIGLVPQDNILFEGTIRFNIALGARPDHQPTDLEIEEACKLANMHETIMALPDGYDTQCGTGGGQLSGGQKQRLAIARALVRKPRLLLLDESTSALDAESERLLQDGLDRATKGITVIAIAHRLHTIRRADVIFMIEDGQCVDKGSHEELMQRSESYRVNVLHQTLN